MYCSKCGKEILDSSLFCSYCGEKVIAKNDYLNEDRKKRNTVYDGEVHKCPNCGEVLKSFETSCSSCGYELRWTKNGVTKVEELAIKLEKAKNISERNELISNFYIPNTREDIIEFFTLAVSQLDENSPCSDAWENKLDQTLIKAKLTFGDSDDYLYLEKIYKSARKSKKKAVIRKRLLFLLLIISLSVIGLALTVLGIYLVTHSGGTKEEQDDSPWWILIIFGGFVLFAVFFICVIRAIDISNKKDEAKEELKKKDSNKISFKSKIKPQNEEFTDGEESEDKDENDENKSLGETFKEIGKDFKDAFKDMFKK